MDNQSPDILPSVELPRPQGEQPSPENEAKVDSYNEQIASKQVEQSVVLVPPSQQPTQPINPISMPLVLPHTPPSDGAQGVAITPQIADDTDLIEKEWVDKAKHIVNQTKHDPHKQNKEMNIMKADYLKKRYNKDIKLSE